MLSKGDCIGWVTDAVIFTILVSFFVWSIWHMHKDAKESRAKIEKEKLDNIKSRIDDTNKRIDDIRTTLRNNKIL